MVVIRLARGGAKKRPFYHVVVTDKRNKRDGRYIQRVGYYNPLAKGQEKTLNLDLESINSWISKGAQPSERVSKLIKLTAENAA
jgi:small subunit ribosomal protein S16